MPELQALGSAMVMANLAQRPHCCLSIGRSASCQRTHRFEKLHVNLYLSIEKVSSKRSFQEWPMRDVKTAILDAAERRMQIGGFGGFSFREIAADVGIKSSSVHYHFPTKENL